jgi:sulfur-oxidizing protein SoxA
MNFRICWKACLLVACVCLPWHVIHAESNSEDALAEYRAMFGDDNPAELWLMRGKELWHQKRGPRNADLSGCDLGRGAGVVEGAYAELPRWFADTGRVQDLETRLVTCMTTLQGLAEADVLKVRFGDGDRKSDLEALAAYVADASKGKAISLPLQYPQEKAAYALGAALFYFRAGPHDYACSTCHGESGKRIRLQAMSKLDDASGAREAYTHWPAYRVSQGELRTMEWRLQDCYRQQRMPQLKFGSEVAVALTMFLAKNAEGGTMAAPAIKR